MNRKEEPLSIHVLFDSLFFQVWVGCRTRGIILIFDAETMALKDNACITCKGISTMVRLKEQVSIKLRFL